MAIDIFAAEHYVNTRKPLDEASALPGWCYTSHEWYQREVETLFRKDWLCVGRVEQIPNPVRWTETIQYLASRGVNEAVEVGPGAVLTGLLRSITPEIKGQKFGEAADLEKFNDRECQK